MAKPQVAKKRFSPAKFPFFAALFLSLAALSCDQDAIFYALSVDQEPKDPIIEGSPANIVECSHLIDGVPAPRLYSGSRNGKTVYFYDANDRWRPIAVQPGGSLIGLAAAGTDLYALVYHGDPMSSTAIKKFDGAAWTDIAKDASVSGYNIHTIFGAGGKIFAGGGRPNTESYAIFCYDPAGAANAIIRIKDGVSQLNGAAELGGSVFLATGGNGVFQIDSAAAATVDYLAAAVPAIAAGSNIVGIAATENSVIAVSRDSDNYGSLFAYNPAIGVIPRQESVIFTGAVGVWKRFVPEENLWKPALLLLGIHGRVTSYTHGYREIALNPATGMPEGNIAAPGDSPVSSVSNRDSYDASLGKHPVNSIMQVPETVLPYQNRADWEPPIFASTQQDGVWAYRLRSPGNSTWNAEE